MLQVVNALHPIPALPQVRIEEFILSRWAAEPEREALIDGESNRRLSFGQLTGHAERMAGGLRRRGLVRGEVVVLLAANGLEFPVMLLGTLLAGGVCAPTNSALSVAEVAARVRGAGA